MRKIVLICILIAAACITPSPALAVHPLARELFNSCNFSSDYGSPVVTYEDVDPITNIGPTATSGGPVMKVPDLAAFNPYVMKNVGDDLITKINDSGGMVVKNKTFLDFMQTYMYLYGGKRKDKFGVWHKDILKNFPVDYNLCNQPLTKKYYFCLQDTSWKYIPAPVTLTANTKTCIDKPDWCPCPPCQKAIKNASGVVTTPAQHNVANNNLYANLGSDLLSIRVNGFNVKEKQSNITFEMTFKDRTPPIIQGCVGGEFPEIGKAPDDPATTGDWYKVDGLTISDNDSNFIGTCLCLAKIDGYPSTSILSDASDWVPQLPFNKIPNDGTTQNVIMPNMCHGTMKYTIFAWDEHGLLNPGDPNIVPNQPQICYGLQNPPGSADLGRDPGTAKPWPPSLWVASQTGSVEAIPPAQIDPAKKRGTGKIHVIDNDLPNLAIRIRSVKDGSTLFFPPVVKPINLPVFSSSDYKPLSGLAEPNAKDYEDFVGDPTKAVFTSQLASKTKSLYFRILEAKPSFYPNGDPIMPVAEHDFLERFKNNPLSESDRDFIRKHFRLESYEAYDTDLNGDPILMEEDTFGERNGFGGEVVAVLDTPLQEDVEYLISVWTDDNVKWATQSPTGADLGSIHPIPTGIDDGEIKIKVPNQVPAFSYQKPIDKTKATSEEIKVVFREPTIDNLGSPPTGGDNISYFHNGKFPFIEVWVKDYSGLQRKIKLYLRVNNENPDIRIIESEHGKSG